MQIPLAGACFIHREIWPGLAFCQTLTLRAREGACGKLGAFTNANATRDVLNELESTLVSVNAHCGISIMIL